MQNPFTNVLNTNKVLISTFIFTVCLLYFSMFYVGTYFNKLDQKKDKLFKQYLINQFDISNNYVI